MSAECLLRSIAAVAPEAVLAVTEDGCVAWASPATEQLLGWPPSEAEGEELRSVAPSLAAFHAELLRKLVDGEDVVPFETSERRRDGETLPAQVTVGPVVGPGPDCGGVVYVLRDLTAERAERAALVEAADEARETFRQSSLPIAVLDLEGRLVSVNDACCAMLGRSREQLVGANILTLLHPMDSAEMAAQMEPLRSGAADSAAFEVVARHADGQSLQLLVDATVLRTADGAARGAILFAQDVTAVRSARHRLDAQERLYRALSKRASDAALVTDVTLTVTYAAPSVAEVLGRDTLDLLSTDVTGLVHPEDLSTVTQLLHNVSGEPDFTDRCTVRFRDGSDEWRWVELTVTNCLTDPDVGGLILNVRDVTAQREARRAMRESEARYRAIVETAQEGIIVAGVDGGIVVANQHMADILGLELEEVYASGTLQRLLPGTQEHGLTPEQEGQGARREDLHYVRPDGDERVLSLSSRPMGDASGLLVMASDVTDSHRLHERLRHQAMHDPLTGLPNRYLFQDRLDMAAARQRRLRTGSTAVMFLDLDGFKRVNDTRGHATGDRLLSEVASRLLAAVRDSDTVARLGGDEFAIICEQMDAAAARDVAERIGTDVFRPVEIDGEPVSVRGSIGIALFPPHEPSRVLNLADTAMYQAKRLGGGGVVLFDGE